MAADKLQTARRDCFHSKKVDFIKYLATQGDLYRNRDHLGQQTAVESHHEGHGIVVRKHQRHLREGGGREPVLKLSTAHGYKSKAQVKKRYK